MSGNAPAMWWFPGDCVRDTRALSLAARGAWRDVLDFMWAGGQKGEMTLTLAEWARQLSSDVDEIRAVFLELIRQNVCDCFVDGVKIDRENVPQVFREFSGQIPHVSHGDVTTKSTEVTLINRRMHREYLKKENARLRKKNERKRKNEAAKAPDSHEKVTPPLPSSNSSLQFPKKYVSSETLGRDDENHRPDPLPSHKPPDKACHESGEQYQRRYMAWAKARTEALKAEKRETWEEAYPAVNLDVEAAKALAYLDANPAKRKKNLARYLTNWFSRTQEKGGTRTGSSGGRGLEEQNEAAGLEFLRKGKKGG